MKFNERHEWADLNEKIATIGISDYAQKELGEIVFVELPKVGAKVKEGEEVAVLESTKSAVDIYSPLTGEIVAINQNLVQGPEKINQSPENEGWIFKIRIYDLSEYESLMDKKTYIDQLQVLFQ